MKIIALPCAAIYSAYQLHQVCFPQERVLLRQGIRVIRERVPKNPFDLRLIRQRRRYPIRSSNSQISFADPTFANRATSADG